MGQLVAFADAYPWVWLCLLGCVGLLIGSFLNVVIYRLPLILEAQWQHDACLQLGLPPTAPTTSITLGWSRSRCTHCFQTIAWRDLFPIASWIGLRGLSRCCQHPISCRYPLIEGLTALLFVIAGSLWVPGVLLLGALVLMAFLIALGGIDADTFLLPDVLTLPLLWLGLLFNLMGKFATLESAVIGALSGYLSLRMIAGLVTAYTGKPALGGGDSKLLAAQGAWLGWQALPALVLIAALTSLIAIGLWRWHTERDIHQPLAFGPWLALGGGAILLAKGG